MKNLYLDTETISLVSVIITIQYAIDNDEPTLYYVFDHTPAETINLIESFLDKNIIGFNIVFDWFHIIKLYNLLKLIKDQNSILDPNELFAIERTVSFNKRTREYCLKPAGCLDLYLLALKGEYQVVMDRKPLYIRKIPKILAEPLIEILNEKIKFKKIFFARNKSGVEGWQEAEINYNDRDERSKEDQEKSNKGFVDLVLKFKPSAGLKILYSDIKGTDATLLEEINDLEYPEEKEYKPYHDDPNTGWIKYFSSHNFYWHNDQRGIKYAKDDITITREVFYHFKKLDPNLTFNDDDSCLAICVAAVRWHGMETSKELIDKLLPELIEQSKLAPTAPNEAKKYIAQFMTDIEKLALTGSSKKVLDSIEEWAEISDEEEERFDNLRSEADIQEFLNWRKSDENGNQIVHPAAIAALKVSNARKAIKRIDIIHKIIECNYRFYPSFRIIGAKSGRMSGTGKFNPQGIPKEKSFKKAFILADRSEFTLEGGDFKSFEVTIFDAQYNDPVMHQELVSGKKIHALFGAMIYGMDYQELLKDEHQDKYGSAKNGFFSLIYGAQEQKFADTVHLSLESAEEGYQRFSRKYQKVASGRAEVIDKFCSMKQPNGIGTKVEWHKPADYQETMLGFRRYFTLENKVCKALFELANKLPESIKNIQIRVIRRDRQQTGAGAICSALYGAAFNIQAQNMRAAGNHVIQGTGSTITKKIQRRIWDIQPIGVALFIVLPMQIHDEIQCPVRLGYQTQVKEKVDLTIKEFRSVVPLLAMDWTSNMNSWADKA